MRNYFSKMSEVKIVVTGMEFKFFYAHISIMLYCYTIKVWNKFQKTNY